MVSLIVSYSLIVLLLLRLQCLSFHINNPEAQIRCKLALSSFKILVWKRETMWYAGKYSGPRNLSLPCIYLSEPQFPPSDSSESWAWKVTLPCTWETEAGQCTIQWVLGQPCNNPVRSCLFPPPPTEKDTHSAALSGKCHERPSRS